LTVDVATKNSDLNSSLPGRSECMSFSFDGVLMVVALSFLNSSGPFLSSANNRARTLLLRDARSTGGRRSYRSPRFRPFSRVLRRSMSACATAADVIPWELHGKEV
jgi:hypothetical protein